MKKLLAGTLIVLAIAALAVFGITRFVKYTDRPVGAGGGSGNQFYYTSATVATSSVGIYSWSTIVSADSGRGYAMFCNDNKVSNNTIYLGMGATGTVSALNGMFGIPVKADSCYEMTQEKMFYGTIYAIASSATSTLLRTIANY